MQDVAFVDVQRSVVDPPDTTLVLSAQKVTVGAATDALFAAQLTGVSDGAKVTLTWTAASDNTGVTGYNIYRAALTPAGVRQYGAVLWSEEKKLGTLDVPLHLRNAPTGLMKGLGYGKGYRYAHDEPDAYAAGEKYFPDCMEPARYYEPADRGHEIKIREALARLRSRA